MLVNRKRLLDVLNAMQLNASNNSLSITNLINFKNDIVYHFNNEIMVYSKVFDEPVKENFCLNIFNLIKLLSKIKDSEIELLIEDTIKIQTAKTEIEMTKQEIKLDYEFNNDFEWINLPDNFIKGINFAGKIIDENNKRFNPILFIDTNKIVATDGKCLIIYNLGVDFLRFFLKDIQIDLLLKFNVKKYCIKDKLIYFSNDEIIIYFNYMTDSNFPPYEKIQIENGKEIQFLDKLNIDDLSINTSILDNENKQLKIEIEKNNIKIKSNSLLGINIKTKIDKQNEFDNISFGINYEYLLDFLKSDFGNEFKTFISDSMIIFENNDVKFITMLMDN